MDVRKKLVELLDDMQRSGTGYFGSAIENKKIADYLIRHGVTVQDGKPLDAFLHPVDAYKGLKAKYLVFKADTGESVENCFVLRPDKDPAAVEALRVYASATDKETLAKDIYNWVGKGVTVQGWIPASEPPKKITNKVIVLCKNGYRGFGHYEDYKGKQTWYNLESGKPFTDWDLEDCESYEVTHWQPLPQPPKGE